MLHEGHLFSTRIVAAVPFSVSAVLGVARADAADLPDERDHALPCRPTIACTAEIVPSGTVEVESGILYRRIGDTGRQWTFPVLLKQSFTRGLQLLLGTNGYSLVRGRVPGQFLDDITIGPKVHLADQSSAMPAVAVSAQASIPTFKRSDYLRTYDALFTGYVTKDVGPLHADWNFGANLWRIEDRPLPQAFTALALSMNLVAPIAAMAECYVFSDAAPVATRDGGTLFALSYGPRPWLVFDAGADVGFFPSTRAYSLFLGMTILPTILWRPE
jgi:hypothetical protein